MSRITAALRSLLLGPLLLVVAVLGLLGSGGVEPAPRATGARVVSVLASAAVPTAQRTAPGQRTAPAQRTAPVHRADSQAPGTVTRAGYAVTSVPSSGGSDLPPGAGPHLVTPPLPGAQSRRPGAPHLAAGHDAAAGRAPPTTTGT